MELYQLALILCAIALALAAVAWLAWKEVRAGKEVRGHTQASGPDRPPEMRRTGFRKPWRRAETPPAPALADPPPRRRKLVPASVLEEAERPGTPAAPPTFSGEIFDKLEEAFELYQRHNISLESYSAMIMAEQQAVERRVATVRAQAPGDASAADLADAESAREAVSWCIEWAYRQSRDADSRQQPTSAFSGEG